jgi:hypothetical protein
MATEILVIKHTESKVEAKIKIDKDAFIDFENDYVHAPDTSLFVGFDYGKTSKETAESARKRAGFKFYKIIEADKILGIPVPELTNTI